VLSDRLSADQASGRTEISVSAPSVGGDHWWERCPAGADSHCCNTYCLFHADTTSSRGKIPQCVFSVAGLERAVEGWNSKRTDCIVRTTVVVDTMTAHEDPADESHETMPIDPAHHE
jgi:hypothetical protein